MRPSLLSIIFIVPGPWSSCGQTCESRRFSFGMFQFAEHYV